RARSQLSALCPLVERLRLLPAATRRLWVDELALAALAFTADAGDGGDRRPACAVRQRADLGKPYSGRASCNPRRRPSVSRHQRQRIRSIDFRIFALTESNAALTLRSLTPIVGRAAD